jgi:hypothetical protein
MVSDFDVFEGDTPEHMQPTEEQREVLKNICEGIEETVADICKETPVVGHVIAGVQYACGDADGAKETALKATRSTVCAVGGVLGGPAGAMAAGAGWDTARYIIDPNSDEGNVKAFAKVFKGEGDWTDVVSGGVGIVSDCLGGKGCRRSIADMKKAFQYQKIKAKYLDADTSTKATSNWRDVLKNREIFKQKISNSRRNYRDGITMTYFKDANGIMEHDFSRRISTDPLHYTKDEHGHIFKKFQIYRDHPIPLDLKKKHPLCCAEPFAYEKLFKEHGTRPVTGIAMCHYRGNYKFKKPCKENCEKYGLKNFVSSKLDNVVIPDKKTFGLKSAFVKKQPQRLAVHAAGNFPQKVRNHFAQEHEAVNGKAGNYGRNTVFVDSGNGNQRFTSAKNVARPGVFREKSTHFPNRVSFKGRLMHDSAPETDPGFSDSLQQYHTLQKGEHDDMLATRWGVHRNEIRAANPEVKDWRNLPNGYRLRIPTSSPQASQMTGFVARETEEQYHTLQKGEHDDMLAERWGVHRDEIRAANPEVQDWHNVPDGYRLRIPSSLLQDSLEGDFEHPYVPSGEDQFYVLQKGEHDDMLAERWGVHRDEIRAANPEVQDWHNVPDGYRLRVPSSVYSDSGSNFYGEEGEDEGFVEYILKDGEHDDMLAERWGIPRDIIRSANPEISNWNNVPNGYPLKVPIFVFFDSDDLEGWRRSVNGEEPSVNSEAEAGFHVLQSGENDDILAK